MRKFFDKLQTLMFQQNWPLELTAPITVAERDALTPVEGLKANVEGIGYQIYHLSAWRTIEFTQDTDTWVLTTNFTGGGLPITTNLARFTHTTYIGTGMTQASGVFTFPRTGIWKVEFQARISATTDLFGGAQINVITDASGTPVSTNRADNYSNCKNGGNVYACVNGLEVTATADIKVDFRMNAESTGVTTFGSSTIFRTGMRFTRIGDL